MWMDIEASRFDACLLVASSDAQSWTLASSHMLSGIVCFRLKTLSACSENGACDWAASYSIRAHFGTQLQYEEMFSAFEKLTVIDHYYNVT